MKDIKKRFWTEAVSCRVIESLFFDYSLKLNFENKNVRKIIKKIQLWPMTCPGREKRHIKGVAGLRRNTVKIKALIRRFRRLE